MKLNFGTENACGSNILNVKFEEYESMRTKFSVIDNSFERKDGIPCAMACFVTGTSGAGKSTLLQQLADRLTEQGANVLYNVGEQPIGDVRRNIQRLGLRNGFMFSTFKKLDEILEHASQIRAKYPMQKLFLICDSLQTIDDEFSPKEIIEKIMEWCKNTNATCFVVGHVTKNGVFKGENTLVHTIDCYLHLHKDDNSEIRTMEIKKNRYGPECSVELIMTDSGLVLNYTKDGKWDVDADFEQMFGSDDSLLTYRD